MQKSIILPLQKAKEIANNIEKGYLNQKIDKSSFWLNSTEKHKRMNVAFSAQIIPKIKGW